MSDFTIKALTSETFGDFAALVERNGGMFAGCWCTKFHPACAEKDQSREARRALKQRLVADGIAHAALVYNGDRAVAWAEYGSPEELPDIQPARSTWPRRIGCPTTGSPASWSSA